MFIRIEQKEREVKLKEKARREEDDFTLFSLARQSRPLFHNVEKDLTERKLFPGIYIVKF